MRRVLAVSLVLLVLTSASVAGQTLITRASTTTLQLQQGGTPASLTLFGQNLATVSSVRVLVNGAPVSGVTAAVKSAVATSIMLELAAAATAAAGSSYQIELVSAAQRYLVPVTTTSVTVLRSITSIPTRTSTSSTQQALPSAMDQLTFAMPTLTGASVQSVQLIAGGSAQTVTLQGTMLDRLTGAHVDLNGARLTDVTAALQPVSGTTQRAVILTASSTAKPRANARIVLDVAPGAGGSVSPSPLTSPVPVEVVGGVTLTTAELFGTPISKVIAGVNTLFVSCGATDAERRFSVQLPTVGYSASGAVPRIEQATSAGERISFLERHSLTPNDVINPTQLLNLTSTAHPSPIPHTITAYRMCMELLAAVGNWKFNSATFGKPTRATVGVSYSSAQFLARAMPAEPSGAISGLNVGILWGHPITDLELADRAYAKPEFDVNLPVDVSNGSLTYGTVTVTPKHQLVAWKSTFFGPDHIKQALEKFASDRILQVASELQKAFEASATRNAISSAMMAAVKAKATITEVVALQSGGSGMWTVLYR